MVGAINYLVFIVNATFKTINKPSSTWNKGVFTSPKPQSPKNSRTGQKIRNLLRKLIFLCQRRDSTRNRALLDKKIKSFLIQRNPNNKLMKKKEEEEEGASRYYVCHVWCGRAFSRGCQAKCQAHISACRTEEIILLPQTWRR